MNITPYGAWPSPISAAAIASASIRLGQTALVGGDVYWTEGRPQQQGRNVLMRRRATGETDELSPAPLNVRNRVHEYGGGAYAVTLDAGVFVVHDDDQQIWRLHADGRSERLTAIDGVRHADLVLDARRDRLICVREDHRVAGREAVNTLVAVSLADGSERILVDGHDFCASPRISPDGTRLAWLTWEHPSMPWDGTLLWLADLRDDGALGPARAIAGGAGESVFQPSWSPHGELHFVSDRSGWWNLYRRRDDDAIQALWPMEAEFGQPQWAFAMSTYGFDARGRIVCCIARGGRHTLARLDTGRGTLEAIATPYCAIDELHVEGDTAVFLGATGTTPQAVVRLDLADDHAGGRCTELRSATTTTLAPAFVAEAEAITFPTGGGRSAHAFFYAPRHPEHRGPDGARPPLIVMSHGGPTGAADPAFRPMVQFWTSRGFAIVDVNYGGSSGYGRAYRERLNGGWGVVDVDDAINAARFLVARGDVDGGRVIARGSSAGGYTTLAALTFHRYFHAGTSLYGIGDLEALVRDTHKFESRYLDTLIGPHPSPRYRERSPIHHVDRLASPLLLLQGAQDKAVPPEQAAAMYEAVRAKGLPVACLLFDGEQHGFRRAATIKRALEAELYFYGRVFDFTPADAIEPVPIANLGP